MERRQKIINLRNKRYTYEKIGEILGISKQRVHQIINHPPRTRVYRIKTPANWNSDKKYDSRNINKKGIERLAEIVRRRDNHTCQICNKIWGEGKRRFDVHHLDPEYEGIKTYENYKRFDRMITLCHKCHLGLPHIRKKISNSHKKIINSLHLDTFKCRQ